LEAAMKAQNIQQRNLVLQGPWKWLLTEFALYYGVSDAYTKLRYLTAAMLALYPPFSLIPFLSFFFEIAKCQPLYRYLSYIMDVATPTADWLQLVYELLLPILMTNQATTTLSHQEVCFFLRKKTVVKLAEISRGGGGMLVIPKISLNSSCLLLYCLTNG
jgi:hypothetical protein